MSLTHLGLEQTSIRDIAREALDALNDGRQIPCFTARYPGFDHAEAYRVVDEMRRSREAAGDRVVGRKIGFTNRGIWTEPAMWGFMYGRTIRDLPHDHGAFPLAGFVEPRIEPEIVFGLAAAPAVGMSESALLGCIEWVAHGFEVVQSIFPGWTFSGADTVAAGGLHGTLLIGSRRPVAADANGWRDALASFDLDLSCNGMAVDHGHAVNVMSGPLLALRHLVAMLASDPVNPSLAPGEIITTGTLTRALPIAAGEEWSTELRGIPLAGLRVCFT